MKIEEQGAENRRYLGQQAIKRQAKSKSVNRSDSLSAVRTAGAQAPTENAMFS